VTNPTHPTVASRARGLKKRLKPEGGLENTERKQALKSEGKYSVLPRIRNQMTEEPVLKIKTKPTDLPTLR
jgi:hypothetical protein